MGSRIDVNEVLFWTLIVLHVALIAAALVVGVCLWHLHPFAA